MDRKPVAHPLVCKLTAPQLRTRRQTVIAGLKREVLERKPTDSGFAYVFRGNNRVLGDVMRFIRLERGCCAFLNFNLLVGGASEDIVLVVSGPEGTGAFIDHVIGL